MKKFLKTSLKVIAALVGLALVASAMGLFDSSAAPETCDELAPHITELSKKQVEILKLYDIKGHDPEDQSGVVLLCTATARTVVADGIRIMFQMEKDADGDLFYKYFPI